MRVAVIGAGIIGCAIAHALLDDGHEVLLIDREGPATGTSQGNAGWIAHLDILPLASAKAWRQVPRWLADPLGPLAIRPAYLPRLAPWLLRFVAASTPARIEAGTRAIAALNGLALPAWERRLAALGLSGHLRRRGQLAVWARAADFAAAAPLIARQRRLGIPIQLLDAGAVRGLEPALAGVAGAALYETGCHVSDPRVLTLALAQAAYARQARPVLARIQRIEPDADGVTLQTAGDAIQADLAVLAAGAWAKPLAAQLGDQVPLDTERGYNATLPPGQLGLSRPVVFENEGFVATPLDTGDRVGGAVEFGGLDAPANMARVDAILRRLRHFLPDADLSGGTRWMGFRPSLPDSLPVIGRANRTSRVIHAFGHAHHGLTQAAATAELVAALVAGRAPAIDLHPFRAGRFSWREARLARQGEQP